MEGGAIAPLLFFMAKRRLMLECLEDVLISYGYSFDEVQEVFHVFASMDEIDAELEHGSILPQIATAVFNYYQISLCDENINFLTRKNQEALEALAAFIADVMDINEQDAFNWAILTAKYVANPKYWKYARILLPVYHILNIDNDIIPSDVIVAAYAEAHQEHWFDVLETRDKLWGKKNGKG